MRHNIFIIFFLFIFSNAFCQSGDDGWIDRFLSEYKDEVEVARHSITLLPGYESEMNTVHAYIDPDLPYNGGYVNTDGDFNKNYIIEFTPKSGYLNSVIPTHNSVDYNKWNELITYFDGLGRKIQTNQVKYTPNGSDIITPFYYDQNNRQPASYLPFYIIQNGTNGPGGYRNNSNQEQIDFNNYFYNNEGIYAKDITIYENSPANRVIGNLNRGITWQNPSSLHPSKKEIQFNAADEVMFLLINTDRAINTRGCYAPGTLTKIEYFDEDNHSTIEYTDLEGRTIAKINSINNEKLITYFLYDILGRLRYILPPLAFENITSTYSTYSYTTKWVQDFAFYYEYDLQNRLIIFKVPGVDETYLVYNARDQLVLSQNGNQRINLQWSFYKYDNLNRQVIEGIYNCGVEHTQYSMQAIVDGDSGDPFETFSVSTNTGYTFNAFPDNINLCEITSINYFDNYQFLNITSNQGKDYSFKPDEIDFDWEYEPIVRNSLTGQIKTIKTHDNITIIDQKLLECYYYDKYSHNIQTIKDNHLGGTDIISYKYNSTNQLLKIKENNFLNNKNLIITTINNFVADKLNSINYKINDFQEISLETNIYNEIGEIKSKGLHKTGNEFMQKIDYVYNIRGWLEKINDIDDLSNDLFAMSINYTIVPVGYYNGNIRRIDWISEKFKTIHQINYTYDNLNRLTDGFSSLELREHLTYDKQGNIKNLLRSGVTPDGRYLEIDNLLYTYNGNQIKKVDDENLVINQNNGFKDGIFAAIEYLYDANGNCIQDLNSQIISMKYSYQNLPEEICISNGDFSQIFYLYDSKGNELAKETRLNQGIIERIDYVGNYAYKNNELQYVLIPQGRILFKNDELVIDYFIRDHLGNTRVVFNNTGEILQDISYYPFGMMVEATKYDANTSNKNLYLFSGKELQNDFELNWYNFGSRQYNPLIGKWQGIDPLAEMFQCQSGYSAFDNNPISKIDPTGMAASPIYDEFGWLLGTDNLGLQGDPIIMDKTKFIQNMNHEDALKNNLGLSALKNNSSRRNFINSYSNLSSRPDYDGIMTYKELLQWGRENGNSPVYLDASKIDLGNLYISDFNGVGSGKRINTVTIRNTPVDTYGPWGKNYMTLMTSDGKVKLNSDEFDYRQHSLSEAWNEGIDTWTYEFLIRHPAISILQTVHGVDNKYGFPLIPYGYGQLKQEPSILMKILNAIGEGASAIKH